VFGDQPAEPGGVPRGVRVRFEHHGIAGREGRAELVEDDLDREIGRRDRRDDPDWLLDDGAHVAVAEQAAARERALPFELVDQPGGIAQRVRQRPIQLRGLGRHGGTPDLGDQLLPQILFVGFDRCL